jgi:hypothetical protein
MVLEGCEMKHVGTDKFHETPELELQASRPKTEPWTL